MNTACRKLTVCLVLLVSGAMALAQSIAPPIAEFRGFKAEDSFRIENKTAQAMLVVLEVKSFTVNDDGKVVYQPLSSKIHVQVGASSFVIPPNDSHTVYYKAVSTVSPASFSILPTMTPVTQTRGVRVNFCIPHMIYLYQKPKLSRSDISVALANSKVIIRNASEKLGRVEFIHTGSGDIQGFPIYPGQTRELVISGDKATVHFEEGFRVEAR
jgi:hypothetical protein